jgi:psp operon transcriptional activator
LIIGERGTGKELVAARLHYLSDRWDQPRITINCAAFAPELLVSEIFGYEPGAFTGAVKLKPGRFELAHRGCLFLDELAHGPKPLQEKLLRVLEYGEFERVGGVETLHVDVRVIAATNQDLPALCDVGKFRRDLLDRLSFEVITLPPLRARRRDIPLLVTYFARRMAREMSQEQLPQFTPHAMDILIDYSWPGNVRELRNVVERAVHRAETRVIDSVNFDPFSSEFRPKGEPTAGEDEAELTTSTQPMRASEGPGDLKSAVEQVEREWIMRALEANRYNQSRAAENLGLSYHQFRRYLKRLHIKA